MSASDLRSARSFRTRGRDCVDVHGAKLFFHIGDLQRFARLAFDRCGDRIGSRGRNRQNEIAAKLDIRVAEFPDGRNIGKKRRAFRRRNGKRAHLPVAHVLEQSTRADEARLDLAGEQVGHEQRVAAIGYGDRLEPGLQPEQLHHEMARAARTGMGVGDRLLTRVFDEFLHRARRQ